MTQQFNTRRDRYEVTNPAGQSVFQIGFPLDKIDYIRVYIDGLPEDAADFNVNLTSLQVTLNTAAPKDAIVTLEGSRVIERIIDFPLRGDLRSSRLNGEADGFVQMLQEMRRDLDRAILLNKAEADDASNSLPLAEAGKALYWLPDKTIGNTSFNLGDIEQAIVDVQEDADQVAADRIAVAANASSAALSAAAAQAAAAGMKLKTPARAATTGALPTCTYNNGAAGVGATLTATANGALAAQDGITLIAGECLLVKNQASTQHNGLYVVTQVGTAGTPWILTRQTDSDTWAEIVAALVTVMEGSTLADIEFLCTSNNGGTMGTTAVTWQQRNSVIADGAVSTAAKIADTIITYVKMAAAAIASAADIRTGVASKLVDAVGLKSFFDTDIKWVYGTGTVTGGATSINVTGLPANISQLEIFTDAITTSGTASPYLRLGRSATLETTGYTGVANTAGATSDYLDLPAGASSGAILCVQKNSAGVLQSDIKLCLVDSATNKWSICSETADSNPGGTGNSRSTSSKGTKALAAALDRFSIITTDTFTAGNLRYRYKIG